MITLEEARKLTEKSNPPLNFEELAKIDTNIKIAANKGFEFITNDGLSSSSEKELIKMGYIVKKEYFSSDKQMRTFVIISWK